MAKSDDAHRIGRRSFFGAMIGGASVAAAATLGGARPAEARETPDERKRARYRVTEHVEAFYRTNRYYKKEG